MSGDGSSMVASIVGEEMVQQIQVGTRAPLYILLVLQSRLKIKLALLKLYFSTSGTEPWVWFL